MNANLSSSTGSTLVTSILVGSSTLATVVGSMNRKAAVNIIAPGTIMCQYIPSTTAVATNSIPSNNIPCVIPTLVSAVIAGDILILISKLVHKHHIARQQAQ